MVCWLLPARKGTSGARDSGRRTTSNRVLLVSTEYRKPVERGWHHFRECAQGSPTRHGRHQPRLGGPADVLRGESSASPTGRTQIPKQRRSRSCLKPRAWIDPVSPLRRLESRCRMRPTRERPGLDRSHTRHRWRYALRLHSRKGGLPPSECWGRDRVFAHRDAGSHA